MSKSHFIIKERENIFKFIALGYTQIKMSNQWIGYNKLDR